MIVAVVEKLVRFVGSAKVGVKAQEMKIPGEEVSLMSQGKGGHSLGTECC